MPTPNTNPPVWPMVIEDVGRFGYVGGDEHPGSSTLSLIQAVVRADMAERDRIGEERYGTRLQAHNGRDSLVDAYQEMLDACVYFRTALVERHSEPLQAIYRQHLLQTLSLRQILLTRDGR